MTEQGVQPGKVIVSKAVLRAFDVEVHRLAEVLCGTCKCGTQFSVSALGSKRCEAIQGIRNAYPVARNSVAGFHCHTQTFGEMELRGRVIALERCEIACHTQ